MKKFLVVYTAPKSAREQMAQATPEQAKSSTDAWMAWAKRTGSALVDLGAPVAAVGGIESKIDGFSILQAESAPAAEALLKDHPHRAVPGATIQVHEFLPLM
jgi:hypothetical protein